MEANLDALLNEPADISGVQVLLLMVKALFNIIREACGPDRKIKLTDLKTDNIGVQDDRC